MRRSRSGRSERHAGACPVPPFPPSRSSRRRRAGPLRRSHYWQTESQLAGNVMKVATLTLGGVRGRRGCAVRWTPSSSRAVSCPSAARLRLCRATASVPCRVCVARRSRPWHNERRLRDACRERAPRVSEPRAGLSFRSLPRCAGTKREQLAPASDGGCCTKGGLSARVKTMSEWRRTSSRVIGIRSGCCRRACGSGCRRGISRGS